MAEGKMDIELCEAPAPSYHGEPDVDGPKPVLTGLELLRSPFPKHQISLLPKPYKKESPKGDCDVCGGYHGQPATHLEYVGHAALTDRLLDADRNWSWEPFATHEGLPAFDRTGGLWIRLTVCGVTRMGYGNAADSSYKDIGAREKEVIGDALRNAAMRFGAALDLWHKGDLHLNDEEIKEPKEKAKPAVKPPEKKLREPEKKHAVKSILPTAKLKELNANSKNAGWDAPQIRTFLTTKFKIKDSALLTQEMFDHLDSIFLRGIDLKGALLLPFTASESKGKLT